MIEDEASNMAFLGRFRRLGRPGREGLGFEPPSGNAVADGQVEGSDSFAQLPAQIENLLPAPQLLVRIGETEGDLRR